MTILIQPAAPDDLRGFFGFVPPGIREAFSGRVGGQIVGMAGVLRDPAYHGTLLEEEGRWIAFFEIGEVPRETGARVVIRAAAFLKSFPDPVYVQCEEEFATAPRLLRLIGFKPTDEFAPHWRRPGHKLRIWQKWPHSQQS